MTGTRSRFDRDGTGGNGESETAGRAVARLRGSIGTAAVALVAVMVAAAMLWAGGGAVLAQEGPSSVPASYYGDVTIDGEPAPEGTEVVAEVDDEERGSIEVTTAGEYGGPGLNDEKLEVEASEGAEVVFVVDGVAAEETVEWQSGDLQQVDLTVEGSADESGSDNDGNDGNTGTGGTTTPSGGNGGAPPADTTDDESQQTDDEQPQTDSEPQPEPEPEPEEATSAEIVDEASAEIASDPDTRAPAAEFEEGSTVERIEFRAEEGADSDSDSESDSNYEGDAAVSGSVTVTELDDEPAEIGPSPGDSVAVIEISVPEEATDRSATLRMDVSADRLTEIDADAEDLRVNRFSAGEWQQLETEVVEQTDDGVTVSAETPGFSYFSVSAVSEPEAALSVAPSSPSAGAELTLDGTGSSVEHGNVTAYEWTVSGDALSSELDRTGETATVAADSPGEYTIELTVRNRAGDTDTVSETVIVQASASGDDSAGTDDSAASDDSSSSERSAASDDGAIPEPADLPGFGVGVAVIALLVAAFVIRYRG
jgi:PGF-pre-PGF domain-containing protein/PGF-CTERM protein